MALHAPIEDLSEQMLLALEVTVDAGAGYSDGGADLIDAGLVEALAVEEAGRRRQDHLPAVATARRFRLEAGCPRTGRR